MAAQKIYETLGMTGTRLLISLLFFISGAAGLIYEVVWAKYLSLFLGNTAQAHTIVLATFMGGMALGYFLFGKIADKARSALSLYGWMEIGIGLCGALFVPLLGWLGSGYISLVSRFGLESFFATTAKFLLTILLLLWPTFLMGGTLPVLSRFVVRTLGEVENQVGWLYFLNSFGAVFGSLLAGFVLIPGFGLNLSIMAAVVLNLLVGLTALALRPREKRERENPSPRVPDKSGGRPYAHFQTRVAIVGIGLSGAAALIYEIAWIRLLSLVLGSSVYSFSLMLAAFIAGIALGSFIVSRRWVLRFDPYLFFALAELGVALSIVLTLPFYERLPFYFAKLANIFVRVPETFFFYEWIKFSICFFLMLFPTLFLGMTLPLVSQVSARSLKRLGENIGNVFAANTVGTLIGAVAAGAILLPLLGIKRLIEVGVVINLLVGASALWYGPYLIWRKKILTIGASFALFVFYLYLFPDWDKNILSSGVFRQRGLAAGMTYQEFKKSRQEEVLYYRDGANMTVALTRAGDGHVVLKVNGKTDASSRGDLPTQILLGQIPLLLKPEAKEVLVIGLGSGITAGSVLRHPIEKLAVVEISPEVAEANHFFAPYNHRALDDPRLRLYLEDAKSFLKVNPQRYDIIISEPSNPWIAGIGNLFSIEFYQDVRKRLQPGGLMVQWLHSYEMTDETLRLVLRTFARSFEYVTLWSSNTTDLILIGSKVPFSVDFKKSWDRFNNGRVREDLRRLDVESFATVLSLQVASDPGVRKAAGKGRINEDIFPILEYEAPKAFFLGQTSQFLVSHDERRYPRDRSSLYFTQYLESNRLDPRDNRDITTYHLTYGSLNSIGLARSFVDLWLRQSPENPEAHWTKALVEERMGNPEVALKELHYLLRHYPDRQGYLEVAVRLELKAYSNHWSLVNSHTPERALTYLHRLLNLAHSKKDRIYHQIAQVHAADRDYQAAINYLEKAVNYTEKNSGELRPDLLWLEAADMALEMDDLGMAMNHVRKALAYNPENNLAKKRLEQLRQLLDVKQSQGERRYDGF